MATEIKLPQLGENLPGGDVLDVKVAAGDTVTAGQTLLEVEAEKSTVEVPSPLAGRVQQILVKKGQPITVGQTLAVVEESGPAAAQTAKAVPQKPNGEPAAPAAVRVKEQKVPGDGHPAEKPKPPEDFLAPVPSAESAAPKTPRASAPRPVPAEPVEPRGEEQTEKRLVPAGPATRRLARELGVDLSQVHGTAPGGRVSQEDVQAYVRELASGRGRSGGAGPPPLPDFSRWGEIERQPLDGIRRKTAEQMSLAWSQIPHVTQHDVADITELEAFRKEREGRGPKLTVTAFALKAAAIALEQFPQFNASLDLQNNQLIVKRYCHIGVAVDTERGLLVPVLRDVDKKSIQQLAGEVIEVAERARQKKLQADEMRGGTFTITNLGGIGGTGFSPIINYPEVAILGMSRGRLQPVVHGGQISPRLMLPLSLSYDHRVIDGANAARFCRRIAEMLETPLVMLLEA
jgi:pyruvate dehydrogenase E2 component (dihydrolipoamide acetyltransferase)